MMYHLSYLDIKHGIKRGGQIDTPPPHAYPGFQISAEIGLSFKNIYIHFLAIWQKINIGF